MAIVINFPQDITLEVFHRVSWANESVEIGPDAIVKMTEARQQFVRLVGNSNTMIYGVTTGKADRSGVRLTLKERKAQAATLPASPAVAWGDALPDRVARGIVLARLANFVGGQAAISPQLAIAVAEMLSDQPLPEVSARGQGGAGEILILSPLLLDRASSVVLEEKDPLSLINGAPAAAALVADATLANSARLDLVAEVFALAVAAFSAPKSHYANDLDTLWNNAHDEWGLRTIRDLLVDYGTNEENGKQAPTSFRIIPRILGQAHRAVSQAQEVSTYALSAITDNPVIVNHQAISNGGFHDAHASAAMDALTSSAANLCILAGRISARITELPTMMKSESGDKLPPLGFLPMAITGYEEEVRRLAVQSLIPIGGASGFGSNDTASPVISAWSKQERASVLLEATLAALLPIILQLLDSKGQTPPAKLTNIASMVRVPFNENRHCTVGEACGELEGLLRNKIYSKEFNLKNC